MAKTTTTKKKSSSKSTGFTGLLQNKVILTLFIILLVLVLASVGVIGYTIYYFYNDPPTTVAVGNVDALTYDPEGHYPIEIQLYTNDRNNGELVYEFKMNFYTDTLIPQTDAGKQEIIDDNTSSNGTVDSDAILADCFKTVYSQGVQFTNEIEFTHRVETGFTQIVGYYEPANAYYYNTANGTSYDAIQALDYKDKWIIDFGEGQLGRITQDAGLITVAQALWITSGINRDINKLIKDIYDSVASLDYGKQVLMFDLSDYLTFEFFSTEDLQFHVPETTEQHLYVNVLINKSENGIVDASQSLFGMVENNSNWTIDGVTAENYWTSHACINLTQADFDIDDGLLTLKQGAIDYFSVYDPEMLDLTIYIDLSRTEATGLARNAFGELQVDNIIISSSTNETFTYYDIPDNCVIASTDNVTLEVVT